MEHYFINNANLKSEIRNIEYSYDKYHFMFLSDNGVFSKNKVDYASKLLLETFLKTKTDIGNSTVLDVGCGYGFLGIVISKVLKIKVDMVDVNKRALHLCERNIKENEIDGESFLSDAYENVKNKYEYIITNPPIRAGKKTILKILKGAKDHLKSDGELWFVMNKDHGAKSIIKILNETYKVEIFEKSKGFYVICAKIIDKS